VISVELATIWRGCFQNDIASLKSQDQPICLWKMHGRLLKRCPVRDRCHRVTAVWEECIHYTLGQIPGLFLGIWNGGGYRQMFGGCKQTSFSCYSLGVWTPMKVPKDRRGVFKVTCRGHPSGWPRSWGVEYTEVKYTEGCYRSWVYRQMACCMESREATYNDVALSSIITS